MTTIVTTVGGKRAWKLVYGARPVRCVFVVYSGDEPEKVREIVQSMREWYDNIGIVHKLTDEELVESLPYRLQSYILWALSMNPDTDEIADQSLHDPFGAMWRTPIFQFSQHIDAKTKSSRLSVNMVIWRICDSWKISES